jgi:hypothetical protein
LSSDGNYLWQNNEIYKIDGTLAKTLTHSSVSGSCYRIVQPDGATFSVYKVNESSNSVRFDNGFYYNISGSPISGDSSLILSPDHLSIYKIDVKTGEIIETIDNSGTFYKSANGYCAGGVYLNEDYIIVGTGVLKYNKDTKTYTDVKDSGLYNNSSVLYAKTFDNKYILCTVGCTSYFYKWDMDTLTATQFRPQPLEIFGTNNCYIDFNMETQTLIAHANYNDKIGIIAKYLGNDKWYTYPFTFTPSMSAYYFVNYPITSDSKLSRWYSYWGNSPWFWDSLTQIAYSKQTVAESYHTYNINSATLTGYVKTGGDNGENIEVSTTMPTKINVSIETSVNNAEIRVE